MLLRYCKSHLFAIIAFFVIQLRQRICQWLIIVDGIAESVDSAINSMAERCFVSSTHACDVEMRIHIGSCHYYRHSCNEVYHIVGRQGCKRSHALIVIHCQYSVKSIIVAIAKEIIYSIRSKGINALGSQQVDSWSNNLLLFLASIACLRI